MNGLREPGAGTPAAAPLSRQAPPGSRPGPEATATGTLGGGLCAR
jgi:hypothetical protein